MPRACFVIMPFSTTTSCTEEEWTLIFEALFKPAVEGAGLDYECRRSVATRGNIVASILQELKENYVVIADLSDQNANVFYELGVRHSLKDRTILLAQKEEDIPFDLRAYAYHIYDWLSEDGKEEFAKRITELLSEIDSNPDRPDNPVSDFLGRATESNLVQTPTTVQPEEIAHAQSLAGHSAEGLDAADFARRLARENTPQAANTVLRLTRAELLPSLAETIKTLNQREVPDRIPENKTLEMARDYISVVEPLVQKVEEFVLASVEEQWTPGLRLGLRLSGDLISLSERPHPGRSIKLAQGAPALLAWRLLLFSGAIALREEAFNLLDIVLKEPIEVEEHSGRFSNQPLVKRRELFWPEALLGNAYHAAKYIIELWSHIPHLQKFFVSEAEYHFQVAKFFMVTALASPPDDFGHPLYPGYRLFPQAGRAMSSLCSRLANSKSYLEGIAKAFGESATDFRNNWSERVSLLNSVELGTGRPWAHTLRFPDPMDAEPPD
jgi:hypothetical protein